MLPIRSIHNLELTVESSNEASLVPAQELIEGINFKKLNSDRLERLQSVDNPLRHQEDIEWIAEGFRIAGLSDHCRYRSCVVVPFEPP